MLGQFRTLATRGQTYCIFLQSMDTSFVNPIIWGYIAVLSQATAVNAAVAQFPRCLKAPLKSPAKFQNLRPRSMEILQPATVSRIVPIWRTTSLSGKVRQAPEIRIFII